MHFSTPQASSVWFTTLLPSNIYSCHAVNDSPHFITVFPYLLFGFFLHHLTFPVSPFVIHQLLATSPSLSWHFLHPLSHWSFSPFSLFSSSYDFHFLIILLFSSLLQSQLFFHPPLFLCAFLNFLSGCHNKHLPVSSLQQQLLSHLAPLRCHPASEFHTSSSASTT